MTDAQELAEFLFYKGPLLTPAGRTYLSTTFGIEPEFCFMDELQEKILSIGGVTEGKMFNDMPSYIHRGGLYVKAGMVSSVVMRELDRGSEIFGIGYLRWIGDSRWLIWCRNHADWEVIYAKAR